MTGPERRAAAIGEALANLLRPLVAELVAEELARQRCDVSDSQPVPYLTVADYAERHRSTAAAVRARIRRGTLHAIHAPGSREYLIPVIDTQGVVAQASSDQTVAPARLEPPGA